jgi:hypothetical protein
VFGPPGRAAYSRPGSIQAHAGGRVVNGIDANLEQLKSGLAWVFERYVGQAPADVQASYHAAQQERRGLWSDTQEPVPPWEYRHPTGLSTLRLLEGWRLRRFGPACTNIIGLYLFGCLTSKEASHVLANCKSALTGALFEPFACGFRVQRFPPIAARPNDFIDGSDGYRSDSSASLFYRVPALLQARLA